MMFRRIGIVVFLCQAFAAWAGGSGLNVMVVVNQNSTNSVQLGNDYCEQRGVPPQNLFRMTGWNGGPVSWTLPEFETNLRDPLLAKLAAAGLSNQVEYLLLSMDIPYRVESGDSANSTTSVLFYGFKTNSAPPAGDPITCSLPDYSSNSYAFSELPVEQAKPNTAETNGFLTFMLTDDTLAGAEAILSRGLAADSSFPTQAVYFEKTSDSARNVRFFSFDNAIFDSRIRGDASVLRIRSDSSTFSSIRGLLTGFAALGLAGDTFVPGSLGDSLTSYAGELFENTGQTSLLAFLNAGAAGSYGTVIEPCNFLQKFPDPLAFFYQSRGFCLAEAYYQSVLNPFQGLFVGEPLSAPLAQPALADWHAVADGTVLSGQALLPGAFFSAAATNLPIGQVDLFIDGSFVRTLTNVPPASGNVLSVTLNGTAVRYTNPESATLTTVAAGLASALNAESNATKVAAIVAGDRIELQGLDYSTAASNLLLSASTSAGSSPVLTTAVAAARPDFLETEATGFRILTVTNATVQGDWLQLLVTKTNGPQISVGVTNTTADTNVADLCQQLMTAINAEPALQGSDGLLASDFYPDIYMAQFLIYARAPGWPAAQVRATLTASPGLVVLPPGSLTLEDNLTDLRPRDHLYVSAGLSGLPVSFTLDTTQLPDGFHELALIGYEGTSVRTQSRLSHTVTVQNTALSASLTPQIFGTNTTLDAPLLMLVVVNTNDVSEIELFTTGGSIGVVSNQPSATFSIPASRLVVGLHPFYALVTDAAGNQFRTRTVAIRIVPSFQLDLAAAPLILSWSTMPGVRYDVLASATVSGPFQQVAAVTASGSSAQWAIPSPANGLAFYRVRLAP